MTSNLIFAAWWLLSPVGVLLILLALAERWGDGKTRWVIHNGRVRLRSTVERAEARGEIPE